MDLQKNTITSLISRSIAFREKGEAFRRAALSAKYNQIALARRLDRRRQSEAGEQSGKAIISSHIGVLICFFVFDRF